MQADLRKSSPSLPRVIVVGAGFGGLNAALELSKAECEVLLIDKRNFHLFQPLLYQVATAGLSPTNIACPLRRVFRSAQNVEILLDEVEDVDLRKQLVRVRDDDMVYHYDYLVLATGTQTAFFGNKGWKEHCTGLKSIEDAVAIRRQFLLAFEQAEFESDPEARRAALTFAIVGGGATGVEMAGAISEMAQSILKHSFREISPEQVRILLIDSNERVLKSFDEKSSSRARRDLEALGVELVLNTRVTDIGDQTLELWDKRADEKSIIMANNILFAAGVAPGPLAELLDVKRDLAGYVIVGPDLAIPEFPNAFAVGDIAHVSTAEEESNKTSVKPIPRQAPAAIQMGQFVGKLIAQEIRSKKPAARPKFRYVHKGSLATIGRRRAVAEIGNLRLGGFFAWALWAVVHIFFLVGFRNKLLTFVEWIWMYFFHQRGVRLVTGKEVLPDAVRRRPDPRLVKRDNEQTTPERYQMN